MPENTTPTVDIAAINAAVAKMSPAEFAEQLTKVRVRQKVQQKKQYAKGGMKSYQAKQREKFKAMKEQALNTPGTEIDPSTGKAYENLWLQINAQAEAEAEAKLEQEAAETVPAEGDDSEQTEQ